MPGIPSAVAAQQRPKPCWRICSSMCHQKKQSCRHCPLPFLHAAVTSLSVCADCSSQAVYKLQLSVCLCNACLSSLSSVYACECGWVGTGNSGVLLLADFVLVLFLSAEDAVQLTFGLAWVAASFLCWVCKVPTCGVWLSQDLLYTVRQTLERAVASTRLPPWPAAATATSRRATIFLARRFGKALRLLHSVFAFDGFLPRRSASLLNCRLLLQVIACVTALYCAFAHTGRKGCLQAFIMLSK